MRNNFDPKDIQMGIGGAPGFSPPGMGQGLEPASGPGQGPGLQGAAPQSPPMGGTGLYSGMNLLEQWEELRKWSLEELQAEIQAIEAGSSRAGIAPVFVDSMIRQRMEEQERSGAQPPTSTVHEDLMAGGPSTYGEFLTEPGSDQPVVEEEVVERWAFPAGEAPPDGRIYEFNNGAYPVRGYQYGGLLEEETEAERMERESRMLNSQGVMYPWEDSPIRSIEARLSDPAAGLQSGMRAATEVERVKELESIVPVEQGPQGIKSFPQLQREAVEFRRVTDALMDPNDPRNQMTPEEEVDHIGNMVNLEDLLNRFRGYSNGAYPVRGFGNGTYPVTISREQASRLTPEKIEELKNLGVLVDSYQHSEGSIPVAGTPAVSGGLPEMWRQYRIRHAREDLERLKSGKPRREARFESSGKGTTYGTEGILVPEREAVPGATRDEVEGGSWGVHLSDADRQMLLDEFYPPYDTTSGTVEKLMDRVPDLSPLTGTLGSVVSPAPAVVPAVVPAPAPAVVPAVVPAVAGQRAYNPTEGVVGKLENIFGVTGEPLPEPFEGSLLPTGWDAGIPDYPAKYAMEPPEDDYVKKLRKRIEGLERPRNTWKANALLQFAAGMLDPKNATGSSFGDFTAGLGAGAGRAGPAIQKGKEEEARTQEATLANEIRLAAIDERRKSAQDLLRSRGEIASAEAVAEVEAARLLADATKRRFDTDVELQSRRLKLGDEEFELAREIEERKVLEGQGNVEHRKHRMNLDIEKEAGMRARGEIKEFIAANKATTPPKEFSLESDASKWDWEKVREFFIDKHRRDLKKSMGATLGRYEE